MWSGIARSKTVFQVAKPSYAITSSTVTVSIGWGLWLSILSHDATKVVTMVSSVTSLLPPLSLFLMLAILMGVEEYHVHACSVALVVSNCL